MIAHVAAADEAKGRVVLELRSGRPSPVAIDGAFRVARAFSSEIESLFVVDENVIALASYPFAAEISYDGRARRTLTPPSVETGLRQLAALLERRIRRLAAELDVPFRARVMTSSPVAALAAACAERGPWNVIAFAEAIGAASGPHLAEVLEKVEGTTGLVLVGPNAVRVSGPVLILAESAEHLPAIIRTSERLAEVEAMPLKVLLIARGAENLVWLEAEARLALQEEPTVEIETLPDHRDSPEVIAEAVRRARPGFVVARFGGLAVPSEGSLAPILSGLECPLLIVR